MVGMFEKNLRRVFYFVIAICIVAALASTFVKAQEAETTRLCLVEDEGEKCYDRKHE